MEDVQLDPQTDSQTPVVTEEPIFPLKARDISAPLAVMFWVKIQVMIRDYRSLGMTKEEAVAQVKAFYFLDNMPHDSYADPKLVGALQIAEEMIAWSGPKKIAD